MNIQKTILGTLAGFVGLFGLGLLIYVVLFSTVQYTTIAAEGLNRELFPGIIAFEIIYALLVTIIFQKWAGISTFNGGLKAGALIGLLLGLAMGLWLFSTTTLYDHNIVWWHGLTWAIRFGIAGGMIGWVLGR